MEQAEALEHARERVVEAVQDAHLAYTHGGFDGEERVRDALERATEWGIVANSLAGPPITNVHINIIQPAHVLMRARVVRNGSSDQWRCVYGETDSEVVGVGGTPAEACAAFDEQWQSAKPPAVRGF